MNNMFASIGRFSAARRGRARRRVARCLPLLVICLGLLPAGRALGADITVTFEGLAPGTAVASQYHHLGIDFTDQTLQPTIAQTAFASSGQQVLNIGGHCNAETCGPASIGASFTSCHSQVQVHIGTLAPDQDTTSSPRGMALFAYDQAGNLVGKSSGQTTPHFGTVLTVAGATASIYSFRVTAEEGSSQGSANLGIDDLSFDAPHASCAPYYVLSRGADAPSLAFGAAPVTVLRGGAVSVNVFLHTSANWTDTITFGASAGPGVTASFSPPSISAAGVSVIALTLKAADNAPLGTTQVQVSGASATTSAEAVAQPLSIPVLVQGLADARVSGIEVTQGIQSTTLDAPAVPGSPVAYHGVSLVRGGITVARVFVDARDLGPNGTLSPPPALVLEGRDAQGAALPGSPIVPRFTPSVLPLDMAPGVSFAQRVDPGGAYVFDLPASWTVPGLSLTARLDAAPGSASGTAVQCSDDPQCASNNSFTLSNITFVPGGQLTIEPVELRVYNSPAPDPTELFGPALNLIPAAYGDARVEFNYRGLVDVSDYSWLATSRAEGAARVMERLKWLLDNTQDPNFKNGVSYDPYNNYTAPGQVVMGVYPWQYDQSNAIGGLSSGYKDSPVAVVSGCDTTTQPCTPYRPLTAIAHELGHALGRVHASPSCGGGSNGQVAETWPPDEQGFLQGVGLDRRPGSGGTSGPYAIIASSAARPVFDFMSYCSPNGQGDPAAWISAPGWAEELASQPWAPKWDNHTTAFSLAAERSARPPMAGAGPQLLVRGFLDHAGKITLTEVEPLLPGVTAPLPRARDPLTRAAGYRIVTHDARGAVLANAPVGVTRSHVDGGGSRSRNGHGGESEITFLDAVVPAAGAASLSIVQHGVTLVQRVAPPHTPVVAIVAPAAGATIDARPALTPSVATRSIVKVVWHTTDPDSTPRIAMVDYSTDGGTTWRPVYLGPDKGSVALSSTYFGGSRTARLRVRVNNGFHEGMAVSGLVTAVGAPPTVRMDSPIVASQGTRLARLLLRGTAFDDGGRPLRGGSLRWLIDGVPVGSGSQVAVTGLYHGVLHITLQATDAQGRTGATMVSIHM